ncbi:MAG TPA: Hsp20/alpha crystallin family protein [Candidatus Udaeobacter sp.]|jgi:HSP20 family protein|nr:Hsp20/alpha crystallin family protein [Candidatus Udaeobacter sp.]
MNTLTHENRDNDRAQSEQFVAPPASVMQKGDGYTLEVEMPGVNKDGLDISVENNELTIVGRRSVPAVAGTLLHRESRLENFRRTFELDPSIDANKISAKVEQGLVTLTLPKAEHVKPRKIAVS